MIDVVSAAPSESASETLINPDNVHSEAFKASSLASHLSLRLFDDLMLSNIIPHLNGSSTPGVEPFDPWLSSLPLELAFQVMVSRYIAVGTMSVSC